MHGRYGNKQEEGPQDPHSHDQRGWSLVQLLQTPDRLVVVVEVILQVISHCATPRYQHERKRPNLIFPARKLGSPPQGRRRATAVEMWQ